MALNPGWLVLIWCYHSLHAPSPGVQAPELSCCVVCSDAVTIVDQAYWQSAIAARPSAAYKGYIIGGLLWWGPPAVPSTTACLQLSRLTARILVAVSSPLRQGYADRIPTFDLCGQVGNPTRPGQCSGPGCACARPSRHPPRVRQWCVSLTHGSFRASMLTDGKASQLSQPFVGRPPPSNAC